MNSVPPPAPRHAPLSLAKSRALADLLERRFTPIIGPELAADAANQIVAGVQFGDFGTGTFIPTREVLTRRGFDRAAADRAAAEALADYVLVLRGVRPFRLVQELVMLGVTVTTATLVVVDRVAEAA